MFNMKVLPLIIQKLKSTSMFLKSRSYASFKDTRLENMVQRSSHKDVHKYESTIIHHSKYMAKVKGIQQGQGHKKHNCTSNGINKPFKSNEVHVCK